MNLNQDFWSDIKNIMDIKEKKNYTPDEVKVWAEKTLKSRLNCAVNKIKYVGGGYFGYVYYAEISKAPYRVVIKACLADEMCKNEARDLQLLREGCPVAVPEVYFTSEANEPVDFICMQYMKGSTYAGSRLFLALKSKAARDEYADKVTDALLFWHNQTNEFYGLTGNAVYTDWFDYYRPLASDILNSSINRNDLISNDVSLLMQQAFDCFDIIFSEPVAKPSLVHGDLNVWNILCDKNLKVTAIIDPLESKWADREYDLFQLRNQTGDKLRLYDTYKKKYKVSKNCDIKCAFYGLFNEAYCCLKADVPLNSNNIYFKWLKTELDKKSQSENILLA